MTAPERELTDAERRALARPVFPALIAELQKRDAIGWENHGRPLMTHDGSDPEQDEFEELLDALVYRMKQRMERSDRIHAARVRVIPPPSGAPAPKPNHVAGSGEMVDDPEDTGGPIPRTEKVLGACVAAGIVAMAGIGLVLGWWS